MGRYKVLKKAWLHDSTASDASWKKVRGEWKLGVWEQYRVTGEDVVAKKVGMEGCDGLFSVDNVTAMSKDFGHVANELPGLKRGAAMMALADKGGSDSSSSSDGEGKKAEEEEKR